MIKKSPNGKLEEFRYDAKLFKQAYKAGLKLKEIEKQEKRRKKLLILITIPFAIFIFFLIVFLFRTPLFKSSSYVQAKEGSEVFRYISDESEISPMSGSIEFDQSFIDTKSALYANLNTGEILYEKNIDEQVYIASITKLMSALISLKHFELSETVEVQKDWFAEENISRSLGLDKGDKITVETLLNAMLISSYNDAAFVLAEHMDGGLESFVNEMNSYAKILGLENTQFYNPSGLDDYGGNLSTVKDLFRLTTIVNKNSFIMNTLGKGYEKLEWDIGNEEIYTTNLILNQYGNIVGKTGQTELAGGCFLGISEDGMMILVLGSENRFDDSIKLLTEL